MVEGVDKMVIRGDPDKYIAHISFDPLPDATSLIITTNGLSEHIGVLSRKPQTHLQTLSSCLQTQKLLDHSQKSYLVRGKVNKKNYNDCRQIGHQRVKGSWNLKVTCH